MNRRLNCLALFALCLFVALPARLWAANGINDEALKAYQTALARMTAGDQCGAESGFKRAAELAPRWGAPNGRLGVIYQLRGLEREAREQYTIVQECSLGVEPGPVAEPAVTQCDQIISNEAYIDYLVNAARLENGLSPLVPDPTVGIVARGHSEEMRDKNYFDHNSPTPGLTTAQDRFNLVFGYRPRCIGENVSRRWGSLYSLCLEKMLQTHQGLMNSPGHRHNILYDTFEWLGVGISVNSKGDYWLTEVFVESGR